MSTDAITTLDAPVPAVEPARGDSPSPAVLAYRESVFAGDCNEAILFDARRIRSEWERDRRIYERRLEAVRVLREELPRLQTDAAEAAQALADAEAFIASPLPDTATVGELRARITAADGTIPTGTFAELTRAMLHLADDMPNGFIGGLKSRVVRIRGQIDGTKRTNEELLRNTGVHETDPAVANIIATIGQIRSRIASRRPALQAESELPIVRAQCEQAGRGELRPEAVGLPAGSLHRDIYSRIRQKLDALMQLAAGRAEAERQNAIDEQELAVLEERLADAGQRAREKLMDPKAMKWCASL